MKVIITLDVRDQPRAREMVAMWAHGLVNSTVEVFHPMQPTEKVGELTILDFDSAEIAEVPQSERRMTKRDLQEKLGASGRKDV